MVTQAFISNNLKPVSRIQGHPKAWTLIINSPLVNPIPPSHSIAFDEAFSATWDE